MEINNKLNKKNLIQAWKKISNDPRIRPSMIEIKLTNGHSYKAKVKGWLHAEHFIFYNHVRNKPLTFGFIPNSSGYLTALEKLKNVQNNKYVFNHFKKPLAEHFSDDEIENVLKLL